jgi:endoglucanase
MKQLIRDLTMLNGIPGNERRVRAYFETAVEGKADLTRDNLGSAIARKIGDPNGPRIMFSGHMDEIGFLVTEFTKEGYIRFVPAGGWWGHVVLGQQFQITTRDDRTILGVVGSKPPHILKDEEKQKVVDLKDMYLDIGVAAKADVEALGINVGDMITPFIESRDLADPKFILAKALDNRIGVALAIEVLENLQNIAHPNVYYAVGTVQEEVGLRGAGTAAYAVAPDIGIALDVTIAHDYPGGSRETELGKGPCLMIYDSSMVGHVALREFAVGICEELKIPFQYSYLLRGGTDAGKIHLAHSGCPSLAVCLASRYIHSHTSIIHADDYENAVRLVTEMVRRLDRATVDAIING